MDLELKHIVGYLPYNCKVVIPVKSDFVDAKNSLPMNLCFELLLGRQVDKFPILLMLKPLSYIKPEEILLKHYFGKEKAGIEKAGIEKELQMIRDGKYNPLQCSYNICDILMSEHFDIYGLIELGLAVNIIKA